MVRRLQRSTDFERVLKTRSRASSPHFALHHLAAGPARRAARVQPAPAGDAAADDLSTGSTATSSLPVDGAPPACAVWLGAVVPKRHARRAVTRSLLKRQIRSVIGDGAQALANGLWVVRLRAPFDRAQFGSAASDALRRQARRELEQVLATAAERWPRR